MLHQMYSRTMHLILTPKALRIKMCEYDTPGLFGGKQCLTRYLQSRIDGETSHHGIHAGNILTAVDFFKHHFLSVIPER